MTATASVASIVQQVEGKTVCERIRYRLRRVAADMTAYGLAENIGSSVPQAHVLFALDAHVAHGFVLKRTDGGPRPLYRWNHERELTDGAAARIEQAFQQKVRESDNPPPAAANVASAAQPPAEPPLKREADLALARATATVKPSSGHGETMRTRILALFTPGEQLSRASILAAMPAANPGTVVTTISNMRRGGDLIEVSSGRYMLPGAAAPAEPCRSGSQEQAASPEPEPPQASTEPPEPLPPPPPPSPAAAPEPDLRPPAGHEDTSVLSLSRDHLQRLAADKPQAKPGAAVMLAVLDLAEPGTFSGAARAALRLGHRVELREASNGLIQAFAVPA